MRSAFRAFLVVAVLALIVLPAGQAGSGYTISLTGFETETDTSGVGGGTREYVGNVPQGENPQAAIRGVGWSESSDVPCHFNSYMRDIDDGHDKFTGLYWSGCDSEWWGDDALVTVDDHDDWQPQMYVRGISICDNGEGNHRLKGIRLYKAKVWKTKKQIDVVDGYVGAFHPANCEVWKKAVYCPTGMIATSLVLHAETQGVWTGAWPYAVQGISLICMKVTWT